MAHVVRRRLELNEWYVRNLTADIQERVAHLWQVDAGTVDAYCQETSVDPSELGNATASRRSAVNASHYFGLPIVSVALGLGSCIGPDTSASDQSDQRDSSVLNGTGLPGGNAFVDAPPPNSPPASCASGTYASPEADSGCRDCPLGHWCADGARQPCPAQTYSDIELAKSEAACKPCPLHTSSVAGAPGVAYCFCIIDYYRLANASAGASSPCQRCPLGARCAAEVGDEVTLEQVQLLPGYWRWRRDTSVVLRCPDGSRNQSGCTGGVDDYCKRGLSGPYCSLCEPSLRATHFYDEATSECNSCGNYKVLSLLAVAGTIMAALLLRYALPVVILRRRQKLGLTQRRMNRMRSWYVQVVAAYQRFSIGHKVKKATSFLQVLTNIPAVYSIRYPETFGQQIELTDSLLNARVPFACIGFAGYEQRLILIALIAPGASILLALFGLLRGACCKRGAKDKERRSAQRIKAEVAKDDKTKHTRLQESLAIVGDSLAHQLPLMVVVFNWLYPSVLATLFRGFVQDCVPGPDTSAAALSISFAQARDELLLPRRLEEISLSLPPSPPPSVPPRSPLTDLEASLVRASEVCYLASDYSVVACIRPLEGGACEPTNEYTSLILVGLVVLVIYVVVLPALLLVLLVRARRAIVEGRSTPLSVALQSLHAPYRPQFFYFELIELMSKGILLGLIVFIQPGSMLQLLVALVFAVCALTVIIHVSPHKQLSDAQFATVVDLGVVLTLMVCTVLRLGELRDTLAASDVQHELWSALDFDIQPVLAVLVGTTAGTLGVLGAFSLRASREAWTSVRLMRYKLSYKLPLLPPFDADTSWHTFISHTWSSGQDQARSIKELLREVLPGIRVFLDVDEISDLSLLEEYVEASQAVIVFASQGYFASTNCMRELRAAARYRRSVIFVCESEAGKGAISLAEEVSSLHIDGPDGTKELAVLHKHLEAPLASPIAWHRQRAFLEVSLLQLAKALIGQSARETAVHAADELVLLGGVERRGERAARLPAPPTSGAHLYVSVHNSGAREFVDTHLRDVANAAAGKREQSKLIVSELPIGGAGGAVDGEKSARHDGAGRFGGLAQPWCARLHPRAQCSVLLLYLDARTWRSYDEASSRAAALARDVASAMMLGMQVLLLHECRGAHRVPFEELIEATPIELLQVGLYTELATPLHGGAHRLVSTRLALEVLVSLLTRPPALWDTQQLASLFQEKVEGAEELAVSEIEGDRESTKASAPVSEDAGTPYDVYLDDEHFVHGIDDSPELTVNPLQLHRMARHNQALHASTGGGPKENRPNKPSGWARLGINVGVLGDAEKSRQLQQLKRLQSHLAAHERVTLPANSTLVHHI